MSMKFFRNLIFKNISGLSLIELVTVGIPFVYLPFVIGSVGIEYYGELAIQHSIFLLAVSATQFGFTTYGTKLLLESKGDSATIVANLFAAKFCVAGALTAASVLLSVVLDRITATHVLIVSMFCFSEALNPRWYFHGQNRLSQLSYFVVLERTLTCMSVIVCAYTEMINNLFFFSMIIPKLMINLWVSMVGINIWVEKPNGKEIWRFFVKSTGYFGSRFVTTLIDRALVILAGYFVGSGAAGNLDIVQKIVGALQIPSNVVCQALFSAWYGRKNKAIIFVCFLLSAAYFMLKMLLVDYWSLMAAHFELPVGSSLEIFEIFYWVIILNIFSHNLGYHFVLAAGNQKLYNASVIIAALLAGGVSLFLFGILDKIALNNILYLYLFFLGVTLIIRGSSAFTGLRV